MERGLKKKEKYQSTKNKNNLSYNLVSKKNSV